MKNKKLVYLVQGAMIAAVYAAATYLSALLGIAYGPIQFRFSEALTILAVFTPAAIPGLTVGCVLGNITSPFGVWDIVFGSAATLAAAIFARLLRNVKIKNFPLLSLLMSVVFNALIVGAEITFLFPSQAPSLAAFVISALEVGAGELAVCLAGGIPVYYGIRKTGLFK